MAPALGNPDRNCAPVRPFCRPQGGACLVTQAKRGSERSGVTTMSSIPYPPSPAAMASRLGHHLLLSLGVVTTVALLAALPALLSGAAPGEGARAATGGQ